jgi:hypothetical protein
LTLQTETNDTKDGLSLVSNISLNALISGRVPVQKIDEKITRKNCPRQGSQAPFPGPSAAALRLKYNIAQ